MIDLIGSTHSSKLKIGEFISESKNRFLCTVKIDDAEEECYVASSCRLDNFLDLRGKRVLLIENKGISVRTKYSVIGVKYKCNYIILNTSWANKAIDSSLMKRRFSFLGKRREYRTEIDINGYKADFYIPCSKTIIEVKSVVATGKTSFYPAVYSERTLLQLKKIKYLIGEGYKCYFFVVSLNPYIRDINFIQNTEIITQLNECIAHGLIVKAFCCRLSVNFSPEIVDEIPIKHGF